MTALLTSGLLGALVTPMLVRRGLDQLRWGQPLPRRTTSAHVAVGLCVGACVVGLTVDRVDRALLPALILWALALASLAYCDGIAHRIPTPLARQATAGVLALLTVGAATAGLWATWGAGLAFALLLGTAFTAAWKFAGAGRGDVRLAALGGLGLGFASLGGLCAGLVAWAAVVAGQAAAARLRGRSLKTEIALGPGLAAGLLVAVIPPW